MSAHLDIQYLHDLSLSLGNSQDPKLTCEDFIQALNTHKKFETIAVWTSIGMRGNVFRNSIFIPIYHTDSKVVERKEVDPSILKSLFEDKKFVLLDDHSILTEKTSTAQVAIFILENVGFLEIHSNHFDDLTPKLDKTEAVISQFAKYLENCITNKRLSDEIVRGKEVEKKVRSTALFPEENPNPVFRVSKYGRLLYANKASFMIMGHLRLKIGKKITPKLIEDVRNSYDRKKREFVLYVNYRYYSFLTVDIRKNGYFNIYGTNVTLLKEGEKKLRKSERRYRELVEVASDIICQTDIKGKITYINPIGRKVLKSSSDEIVGKNFFELVHPKQQDEVKKFYINQIRSKLSSTFLQFPAVDLEGNQLWVEQHVQPLIQEGVVKGFSAIARDVTDRVVGDELLKASEEKLRSVIDHAFDGIITINEDHKITEWNPQAYKIFGYTAKEALGTTFTDKLCDDKKLNEYTNIIKDFLHSKEKNVLNKRYEFNGVRKSGEVFPIELTISPMKINNSHFFSIFTRDITIEKKIKKELERALRKERELGEMKSKFVSMTSHEFRTPLTTIRSSIELLSVYIESQEVKLKEKIIKNLNRINDEISRLTRLMNDILTIGRLDSSRMTYNPTVVDITSIANGIIKFNFSKDRKVSLKITGKKRKLSIDENIFTHILTNLITNALKYSPDTEPPEVKIDFKKTTTSISVRDHGIGIPKEDMENLFSSFFRASNVGNIQGTGLGLSIVKQFVEMMGGEIKVKSQLNEGSEFVVKLFC